MRSPSGTASGSARGVAPVDFPSLANQQARWCRSSLLLMFDDHFQAAPFDWKQRTAFWAAFLYYLSSAALLLTCCALVNPGDGVLLSDPSYPCNRHFVAAAGGVAALQPASPEERFQLSAAKVEAAWTERTHW